MELILKAITRGTTFPYAGYNWIVLQHQERGTLVVMDGILLDIPFDEHGKTDWCQSTARRWLNEAFVNELAKLADDNGRAIIETTIDVIADDSTFRKSSTDSVFLLSCDEYRSNRDIIEPIEQRWWTRTCCGEMLSHNVCVVDEDGNLRCIIADTGKVGLRPALLLSSNLLIVPTPDAVWIEALTEDDIDTLAGVVTRLATTLGLPALKAINRAMELAYECTMAEADESVDGEQSS